MSGENQKNPTWWVFWYIMQLPCINCGRRITLFRDMISCPFCNTRIYKKSPKAKEIKKADSDKTQEDLSADESTDIESFYNEAIDQIEYNDRYKDLSNGAYPSVKIFGDEYEDEDKDGLVQPNS